MSPKEHPEVVSGCPPSPERLDTKRWWDQKLEDIQSHSKRWMALFQHSYFHGRNLIQGMYFGKQRYWLFSLVMPDSCIQKVQAEADTSYGGPKHQISAWNKKRDFEDSLQKKTVVGKRSQGGLGNTWMRSTYLRTYSTYLPLPRNAILHPPPV
jgi:hypothetical protein